MTRPETAFRGPLFLIGMPRSGTKLLRDLLNRSPWVGIPASETEFLPWWIAHWERWGDLSDRRAFSKFYHEVVSLPYFVYMHEESTGILPEADWYAGCRAFTPEGVFEALVRHDARAPVGSDRIWGDKSPSYISHMRLLKIRFPEARFIHIVRDVRDHVISMQKAWSKHPIRATQRWVDGVSAALRDAEAIPGAVLRIRYEDLLSTPEPVIRLCCEHLAIPFDPIMLDPGRVTENLGDAVGLQGLKRDNAGKWRKSMDPALRARVEAIAGPLLRELGYPVEHVGPARRVPALQMRLYQANDAIGLVRGEVAERGWVGALRLRLDTWRYSGNRG